MIKKLCTPGSGAATDFFLPVLLVFALFLAAIAFRPLLPIDETRYMTVAWEMHLREGWLAPLTVNFEPYHHKPPFLFWMINLFWAIFGVSRWAAAVPVALAALAYVFLTRKLAHTLFPERRDTFGALPLLVVGSIPFLIYGTLMMFDITLTVFVLCALLSLLRYADSRKPVWIVAMALALGFGILTKGPVAWLYVLFPVLLMPYWKDDKGSLWSWYGGCFLAYLLSLLPVLVWLVPVLQASSESFAVTLIWKQTAGRITGSMGNTHDRPFWFYLPLLPVLFLPWLIFPSVWRGLATLKSRTKAEQGVRFLVALLLPTFIAFSLISGKQPHYLVPLVPGALILVFVLSDLSPRRIIHTATIMAGIFIAGQAIAEHLFFERYDLKPIATYVHDHPGHDWAFVRNYHGELTYLGRLEEHIDDETRESIAAWFAAHPNGMAVIRYHLDKEVAAYEEVYMMPYRGKNIGIFKAKKPATPSP